MNPVSAIAAGHMSAHDAAMAAWAVIGLILLCLFWGLLKLLGLR